LYDDWVFGISFTKVSKASSTLCAVLADVSRNGIPNGRSLLLVCALVI
jgi:hypothetical protein